MRTVGVEEEFLLVNPAGRPIGVAGVAADGEAVELELMEQMLETGTVPCLTAAELADELDTGRRRAARSALEAGAHLVALATSPKKASRSVTAKERYVRMVAEFGLTASEQLTCGCHVHVEVADADEGVAVLDRIGPWLPCVLALSANSPFWEGVDSGYASYRSQVWQRWPTAGPTSPFSTGAGYASMVKGLLDSGAALDAGMIYFDARLSQRYPTVEVRVADVCLRAADAVLVALLVRALVETAARAASAGEPPPETRVELLRAAAWRAGRDGLEGTLVEPGSLQLVPAETAIGALLEHVRPVLADHGETGLVASLWSALRARGTGAKQQRTWAGAGLTEVLRLAGDATLERSVVGP